MKSIQNIDSIKNISFIVIPLSIVTTYIGISGFYLNLGIDITPYLSFEDITIIYSKYTALSILYLFMIYLFFRKHFNDENENSFWDKNIGKSKIKFRLIPASLVLISLLFLSIFFEIARTLLSFTIFALIFISILINYFEDYLKANNAENKSEFRKKNTIDELNILSFTAITVFFIPFSLGSALYKLHNPESIIIYTDNNKIIDAQHNSNMFFIGKNSNYIFLKDKIDNSIQIYPIDKIEKIEYCIN